MTVLEIAGDIVQPNIVRTLMRIIAEGADEDDEEENEEEESSTDLMRLSVVDGFLKLCEKSNLPQVLVQVIAWTLGEYGFMVNDETPLPEIAKKFVNLLRPIPKQEVMSSLHLPRSQHNSVLVFPRFYLRSKNSETARTRTYNNVALNSRHCFKNQT